MPSGGPFGFSYLVCCGKTIDDEIFSMGEYYFSSLFLYGFKNKITGERKVGDIYEKYTHRKAILPTESSLLEDFYINFNQDIKAYYYRNGLRSFLTSYYSQFRNDNEMTPLEESIRHTTERRIIEEFLYEQARIAVENEFKILSKTVNSLSAKYKFSWRAYLSEWEERTLTHVKQIIRSYCDAPTASNHLIKKLSDIADGKQDEYIIIKASTGGQGKETIEGPMGWSLQRYQENPLLLRGIKLFIPINKLREIYFDVRFTLDLTYASRRFSGYRLQVPWSERTKKAERLYNEYYDIFAKNPSGTYSIIFTTEMGGGVSRNGAFATKYKTQGFERGAITFDNGVNGERQKALASMVFYLLFMPDAFCMVKLGGVKSDKNFLFANALGICTHRYFRTNCYPKTNSYSPGIFLWEDDKEAYNELRNRIRGIISDGDLRFFLYFHFRSGADGSILDHYMEEFNSWFKNFKKTNDNLNTFEGIDDLRRPLS